MIENVLIFRKLNIIKAPGFIPPGFSVEEIKPQLNIVYGPNAAGKTTMARAISYLIWPEKAPEDIIVQGEFTVNKDSWFVNIDAGKVTYQKNGTDTAGPPFPPGENRDRYYIALHELLQQETGDQSLAEIILKESAGGYQISEAVAELNFKDKPSHRGKSTRIARNKMREYQKAVNKQEELVDEERQLESLQQELIDINKAKDKMGCLNQVLEYVRVDEEYEELKAELTQFPETISNLSGNEDEQLQELEHTITDYINKKQNAETSYERAQQKLEKLDLPETGVSEKKITTIKDKRDRLKTLAVKKEQLQANIREAESRREEEQKNFIDLIDADKLAAIDGINYNQLSDFARRAEEVNNRINSLKSLKDLLLTDDNNSVAESIIQKGIQCLQKWLQSPEEKAWKNINKLILISSLVILLMTLYLGYTIYPLFFLLTIIPAGIFWYGREQTIDKQKHKQEAQEEFNQLSLTAPSDWNQAAVKTQLQWLYDQLTEIKLTQRRKQYWQDRNKEFEELKEEQEKLSRKRQELINRFGVAPDTESRTLYYLTNHLSRWQDAYNKIQSLKSKLDEVTTNYKNTRDELNRLLSNYGYGKATDIAEINGQITELESRNNKFLEAKRDKHQAQRVKEEVEEKLQQAGEKKEEIYEKAGLKMDDNRELLHLCNLYDDYKEIKGQLAQTEFLKQRERKKLGHYTNFKLSMLDKSQMELEREISELKMKVDKSSEIQKNINSIDIKIKTAKKGRDVEKALADKERALDQLQSELNQDYEKLTGKVLADYIREVNTVQNRPRVFQKAREFFAAITRGNYQLEISNDISPSFRAIETESGEGKSLKQLSSGTRIQLLLAVRMAFIDEEESGIAVPLFLDETLANADDIKAEAIIESVIELAYKGRQCFYFTAQRDEVNKWLSLAGDDTNVEVNIIDLSVSKQLSQSQDNSTLYLPVEEIIPDIREIAAAEGLSHEEYYQRLVIPSFDPRQGPGSIHLWYLIEDPDLIKYLLHLGIEKWGQLKTLLATGKDEFIPESKKYQLTEIQQLGHCLEEFVECWQIGRGQPVDRAALLDSGAVSDNFIDEVTVLAEKVEGDAEAIIKELRNGTVSRFLSKKIDELEQYFEEENYISSREPLSGEEIYAHMLSVVKVDGINEAGDKVKRLLKRISGNK